VQLEQVEERLILNCVVRFGTPGLGTSFYHMTKEAYHMAKETYHMTKEAYHMTKETSF